MDADATDPAVPERPLKILAWALLALLLQFHVRQTITSSAWRLVPASVRHLHP